MHTDAYPCRLAPSAGATSAAYLQICSTSYCPAPMAALPQSTLALRILYRCATGRIREDSGGDCAATPLSWPRRPYEQRPWRGSISFFALNGA